MTHLTNTAKRANIMNTWIDSDYLRLDLANSCINILAREEYAGTVLTIQGWNVAMGCRVDEGFRVSSLPSALHQIPPVTAPTREAAIERFAAEYAMHLSR